MLSTVAKRVTNVYKENQLSEATKLKCTLAKKALKHLQRFISTFRGNSVIREALGTALSLPIVTRWASVFKRVNEYLKQETQILTVLNENSTAFVQRHNVLMTNYRVIFNAYVKVVGPISKFIIMLEVTIKFLIILY